MILLGALRLLGGFLRGLTQLRSLETVTVETSPMVIVGAIGLVINIVSMVLLRGGASESINVKGAYLEVVADAAGSVGVIVAGLLIFATGDGYWDTVVALAIGALLTCACGHVGP